PDLFLDGLQVTRADAGTCRPARLGQAPSVPARGSGARAMPAGPTRATPTHGATEDAARSSRNSRGRSRRRTTAETAEDVETRKTKGSGWPGPSTSAEPGMPRVPGLEIPRTAPRNRTFVERVSAGRSHGPGPRPGPSDRGSARLSIVPALPARQIHSV